MNALRTPAAWPAILFCSGVGSVPLLSARPAVGLAICGICCGAALRRRWSIGFASLCAGWLVGLTGPLASPDALAGHLAEIEWYGLPREELTQYRARVAAVSRADVKALVERAVPSPEATAVVVVGPAAEIVPALESLGPLEVTTPERCGSRASG